MDSDIVFVYMNVVNGYITGAEYQLNSAYTRSYLDKNGIPSTQYINKNPSSHWEIVNELNKSNSKNIVFFINEYNYYISKLIINDLKSLNNTKTIYAFGPVIQYICDNLANEISIDIYLLREEFRALEEIITSKEDYKNINNIAYRLEHDLVKNKIVRTDYSLDDLGLIYGSNIVPPEEVRGMGMLSSMGCYGNCSFCSYFSKDGFKTHSIESIISELDYLSYYVGGNITPISFFDDCFSVSTERTIDLCERIKVNNYNFQFWCCTRADLLNEDVIDLMAECGFKNIVIGLESASIDVFSKIGKVNPDYSAIDYLENIKRIYKYAVKKEINPLLSVNFGLPFEKLPDATKTIQFLKDNYVVDNVSVCFTTSFPGSQIFEKSDFYGVNKKPSPTSLPFRTYYKNYNMRTVYDHLLDFGILKGEILENISQDRKCKKDFLEYFTGEFDNSDLNCKIKFIEIRDNIEIDTLEFIDKYIDLNGTVICSARDIKLNDKALYSDDRKRLKLSIENYDSILKLAYDHDKYFPKMAFINNGMVQPDDVYRKNPFKFKIKELNNIDDLSMIMERALNFLNSDIITEEDLKTSVIRNSCMFTGKCSVCSLRRIEVVGKDVFTCCDKLKIGSIDDAYNDLLTEINSIIEKKDELRNCTDCEAVNRCSKCIILPEFMSDKEYCDIVIRNDYLVLFLRVVNFLYSNLDKFDRIKATVYSSKKYNKLNEINLKSKPRFSSEVVFIEIDNFDLLLKTDNNNVLMCNSYEKSIILYLLGIGDNVNEKAIDYQKALYKFRLNGFVECD